MGATSNCSGYTLADALQKEVVEGTLSSKKAQDIARLPLLEQEVCC